ncbi:zinc metalloproteinase nas-15 [Nephila pilipes]|uniref:Metalloendopeptidase n=1 Tax=Nephila pilipes TaxID=299642 RepID=A0A8X6TB57_NEPPI|nr:zinc metalloproteinase nas-15 [Nephila pilipes]
MAFGGMGHQNWTREQERDGAYKIHYVIQPSLNYNRNLIERAMKEIETYSRIEFVRRNRQRCYLTLTKDDGCYFTGTNNCMPRISLGMGCQNFGTILHELMHAIGFPHEQNRPDRDSYLIIHWNNIKDEHKPQFRRLKGSEYQWNNLPLDFESIMMYDSYAFSRNGGITIERKYGSIINRNERLSNLDKQKLNMI